MYQVGIFFSSEYKLSWPSSFIEMCLQKKQKVDLPLRKTWKVCKRAIKSTTWDPESFYNCKQMCFTQADENMIYKCMFLLGCFFCQIIMLILTHLQLDLLFLRKSQVSSTIQGTRTRFK